MKRTNLYAIIVIVILAIVIAGWYYFSSVGNMIWCGEGGCGGGSSCPKWKCTDIKTYTCPTGTTNYTCSNGLLTCYICTTNYTTKNYNITLITITYQNTTNGTILTGIFSINGESVALGAGQIWTISDGTRFGVTTLYLNYSAFYLQSSYETKSSSLTAPFPKSTTVTLIVSTSGGCGAVTNSCPTGYTPSCSGNKLICIYPSFYSCSYNQPISNCTRAGSCRYCPLLE